MCVREGCGERVTRLIKETVAIKLKVRYCDTEKGRGRK